MALLEIAVKVSAKTTSCNRALTNTLDNSDHIRFSRVKHDYDHVVPALLLAQSKFRSIIRSSLQVSLNSLFPCQI